METIFGLALIALVVVGLARKFGAFRPSDRARAAAPRPDLSSAELHRTLERGALPAPVDVSFRLELGEVCYGVVEAEVEQWLEGDSTYTHKYVGWAGGLAGLAIGTLTTSIGNAGRKAAAAREAAARWRLVGAYRIYLTTERIAFEGGGGREWHEIWLRDLRRIEVDGSALELRSVGGPASRLHVAPVDYWSMLLRRLAFGEVPGQLSA